MKRKAAVITAVIILALTSGGAFVLRTQAFARAYTSFCARNTILRGGLELSLALKSRPDANMLKKIAAGFGQNTGNALKDAASEEFISNLKIFSGAVGENCAVSREGREKRKIGGKERTFTVYALTIPKEVFAQASEAASLDSLTVYLKDCLTRSVEERLTEILQLPESVLAKNAVHKSAEAAVDLVFPKIDSGDAAEKLMNDVEIRFFTRFGFLYAIEGSSESFAGALRDICFELNLGNGGFAPIASEINFELSCNIGEKRLAFSAGESAVISELPSVKLNMKAAYGETSVFISSADIKFRSGSDLEVNGHSTVLDYTSDYTLTGEIKNGTVTMSDTDGNIVMKIGG